METRPYTLTIFTENQIGLLNRISNILTRRKINIDSLTTSASELKGIYRFTIIIQTDEAQIQKLIKQFERQVEVIKAYAYIEDEVISQEIALYKLALPSRETSLDIERIIRDYNARIVCVEPNFIVIEKSGYEAETEQLLEALRPFKVLSFARSGRVAISRPPQKIRAFLSDMQTQPYPYVMI